MGTIRVIDEEVMVEICYHLTRKGVTFDASKKGDGYWHIVLSGF